MSVLHTARFFTTVVDRRRLPPPGVPEVAFIGRSNAGKSSAINVLCQRRRLAFSSRTPGRTQALNFYAVGRAEAIEAFLVDMPGYGYAAAPGAIRGGWDALAGRYLQERRNLRGAVMMIDIRRLFTDLDRKMLAWLPPQVPLLVLLTKSDKFARAQQVQAERLAVAELGRLRPGPAASVILFSVTARRGIEQAQAAIVAWLQPAAAADSAADASTPDPETQAGQKKPRPRGESGYNALSPKAPAQGGEAGVDP
jgi:GTP-binding protein